MTIQHVRICDKFCCECGCPAEWSTTKEMVGVQGPEKVIGEIVEYFCDECRPKDQAQKAE